MIGLKRGRQRPSQLIKCIGRPRNNRRLSSAMTHQGLFASVPTALPQLPLNLSPQLTCGGHWLEKVILYIHPAARRPSPPHSAKRVQITKLLAFQGKDKDPTIPREGLRNIDHCPHFTAEEDGACPGHYLYFTQATELTRGGDESSLRVTPGGRSLWVANSNTSHTGPPSTWHPHEFYRIFLPPTGLLT